MILPSDSTHSNVIVTTSKCNNLVSLVCFVIRVVVMYIVMYIVLYAVIYLVERVWWNMS